MNPCSQAKSLIVALLGGYSKLFIFPTSLFLLCSQHFILTASYIALSWDTFHDTNPATLLEIWVKASFFYNSSICHFYKNTIIPKYHNAQISCQNNSSMSLDMYIQHGLCWQLQWLLHACIAKSNENNPEKIISKAIQSIKEKNLLNGFTLSYS